ncbi:Protein disulfide-isomerase A3 [Pseudolycoriella hygida]|uniref:protein disulfide-isomerase n=1 Tax=Pseudolycoriella hygida TaxID=35572 RepID=A0A9Q0MN22_9DIPT|nr:Protein disulfide-isomerase A3 [Pseudolycoriella hygida]
MNFKVVVCFLTITGFSLADLVLEATDENFESLVATYDTAPVMFYLPWCTFCNKQLADYQKAASILKELRQPIQLIRVNCNDGGKVICARYSIERDNVELEPKYKIFRKGILGQDYFAENADGIVRFLKTRYGIASTELFTVAEVEKFLNTREPAVIGFFEKGSDIETFFKEYAEELQVDYRFGHSSASEVLSKYNEKNSIVFFRPAHFHNKFEPNFLSYNGSSKEELTTLIQGNYHGLVGHRRTDNAKDFEYPNVIAYYAVDYESNVKKTNYWRNRILQVAKDHRDYRFAISSSKEYALELENYGHSYLQEKPFVTARDEENRKYKMNGEFSVENLEQFVVDLKAGKLEPYIKSSAIPTSNDGPVKIAVAKNFHEIVTNNGKDTFLEIYAPWCQYCKDLEPVIEELGEKMIGEDVEIVKFDGTNNEVPPGFELQGYPQLFWLSKTTKNKPATYRGPKTLEKMISYIAEFASDELKNYDRSGQPKKTEL